MGRWLLLGMPRRERLLVESGCCTRVSTGTVRVEATGTVRVDSMGTLRVETERVSIS